MLQPPLLRWLFLYLPLVEGMAAAPPILYTHCRVASPEAAANTSVILSERSKSKDPVNKGIQNNTGSFDSVLRTTLRMTAFFSAAGGGLASPCGGGGRAQARSEREKAYSPSQSPPGGGASSPTGRAKGGCAADLQRKSGVPIYTGNTIQWTAQSP